MVLSYLSKYLKGTMSFDNTLDTRRALKKSLGREYSPFAFPSKLIFEVVEARAKEIAPQLQEIMQNVVRLDVPIDVTVGIGKNWGKTK